MQSRHKGLDPLTAPTYHPPCPEGLRTASRGRIVTRCIRTAAREGNTPRRVQHTAESVISGSSASYHINQVRRTHPPGEIRVASCRTSRRLASAHRASCRITVTHAPRLAPHTPAAHHTTDLAARTIMASHPATTIGKHRHSVASAVATARASSGADRPPPTDNRQSTTDDQQLMTDDQQLMTDNP